MDETGSAGHVQDVAGLTARVAALEETIARLETRLDGMAAAQAARTVTREQRWAAPPPPPPPAPAETQHTADAPRADEPVPQVPIAPDRPFNYPIPPRFEAAQARPEVSFENRLGSQWFNRIGIVLLLIGTSWFLKLAIDRGWIGPMPRVIIGLLAGTGIVLWSERFRQKGFAAFSYSLKALGSSVLYLSLWAGFRLYDLLPANIALLLMIAVTGWNAFMAWAQDSELLAAYALAGGFVTPLLLSTGGNHEIFLFSYLLAIDIATVVLVRLKRWPRLLLGAFPLTVLYFIGWYILWYKPVALAVTSVFIVLFDSTFSTVPLRLRADSEAAPSRRRTTIEDILMPPTNGAFAVLAFYSVLQDAGYHDLVPWMVVLYGAIYLAFVRLPQSPTARAIHLSIAIVLLTIAVPLKASGHWITVGWLVEGLALVWVSTRLATDEQEHPDQAYAIKVLQGLGLGALGLGFLGVVTHTLAPQASTALAFSTFFNDGTTTALIAIAVFAGAAWITRGRSTAVPMLIGAVLAIDATALLLSAHELFSWTQTTTQPLHPAFASAAFLTALLGLMVFAALIAIAVREIRDGADTGFWGSIAAATTLAFNFVALLTGVREISAIWESTGAIADLDAALKEALAISAYLMIYGAALVAVGFWRRSAFLRWQGLALLVFTIVKAFLYDMRNLSQGYRVASFLALGALLMAISFAYQKDWLALRNPAPTDDISQHHEEAG